MEVGEEVEAPLLMVVEVPAVVEEEGGRPCSLVEVLLGGPQRAQQGGLGKENLEGKVNMWRWRRLDVSVCLCSKAHDDDEEDFYTSAAL